MVYPNKFINIQFIDYKIGVKKSLLIKVQKVCWLWQGLTQASQGEGWLNCSQKVCWPVGNTRIMQHAQISSTFSVSDWDIISVHTYFSCFFLFSFLNFRYSHGESLMGDQFYEVFSIYLFLFFKFLVGYVKYLAKLFPPM